MAEWLKECEICTVGLCKEMTYLTDSVEKGGMGLPVREAAKRLEEQSTKQIGERVWSAEQIRYRYLYHTGQLKPGRKPTAPEKTTPRPKLEIKTDPECPASDFAAMAISQLERISKDDPHREEALNEVQEWIQRNRKNRAPSSEQITVWNSVADQLLNTKEFMSDECEFPHRINGNLLTRIYATLASITAILEDKAKV